MTTVLEQMLRTDENNNYLCPMSDPEGGDCTGLLVLEMRTYLYLGPDLPQDEPLSVTGSTTPTAAQVEAFGKAWQARHDELYGPLVERQKLDGVMGERTRAGLTAALAVDKPEAEDWTVRCEHGHVLVPTAHDGSTSPAFRLDRFLAGESYRDPDPDDLAYEQALRVHVPDCATKVNALEVMIGPTPLLVIPPGAAETSYRIAHVGRPDGEEWTRYVVELSHGATLLIPEGWEPPKATTSWGSPDGLPQPDTTPWGGA